MDGLLWAACLDPKGGRLANPKLPQLANFLGPAQVFLALPQLHGVICCATTVVDAQVGG